MTVFAHVNIFLYIKTEIKVEMIKFYCHAFTTILFTEVALPWHSMENTDGSLATRLKMPSDIRAKLCQARDYL